jgi:uncharacterized protein DUF4329
VDVGLDRPNKGCPEHSIPLAYYHTHPTYSVAGMRAEYKTFSSDDDIGPARSNHIDAYLGTLDGSFLKYDYKTERILRLGRLKILRIDTLQRSAPMGAVRQPPAD